ncbi:restriction endonuclease subunit S [Gilliamella sp. B3482]|uniref:restriction endonuclease subunit S n=1 Tax=Gilliamella sp. B3482 TaxID=2817991 RepID=UPI00226AD355|nr:restriction endonuclease subunit S [Gilliamella sp. B3482]MCX8580764.1 restriction endonuclease subunit S [Gilliamella sp. B3482]
MSKYLRIDEIVESISKTHKFDIDILKFLNTSDIYSGKIININYLPLSQLKGQAKKTIKKNDILFSEIRPQNKRFAYVDFDETYDFVVSTKLMVLRNINPLVDNKYFYYFLTNDHMLSVLQTRAENRICSFPQITFDLLSDYKVRVPDINEQKRISSLLSSLDKKIELNNQINAELESMAKTLYDYWFVQFDFPDENGKPYKSSGGKMVYNSVLKREIPEGWQDKKLSDIANITMGQSPNGGSYNENGDGVIFFQGSTDFGWLFPSIRQFTNQPIRLAKKGDILLSVRAPVGDMNIANNDCCIGRGLAAMNSKESFDVFLFYVMKYFKTIFERRNSEGTTFGSITKNDLRSLQLSYPSPSILKKYEAIVSNYNKMIFEKSLETEKLTKLRDFLIPMLMNGQVTIKE